MRKGITSLCTSLCIAALFLLGGNAQKDRSEPMKRSLGSLGLFSIHISPDGAFISALSDAPNQPMIFDLTRHSARICQSNLGVQPLAFSPDSRQLLLVEIRYTGRHVSFPFRMEEAQYTAYICDTASGKKVIAFGEKPNRPSGFLGNEHLIYANTFPSYADTIGNLLNIMTGSVPRVLFQDAHNSDKSRMVTLTGVHGFPIGSCSSMDGRVFAILFKEGDGVNGALAISWFDLTGKRLGSIDVDAWGQKDGLSKSQRHYVCSMVFLPDNRHLVTLGDTLVVWDLTSRAPTWTANVADSSGGTEQHLSASDRFVAVVKSGHEEAILVFEAKSGNLVRSIDYKGYKEAGALGYKGVGAIQLTPSDKLVLVSKRSPSCQGKVYDMNTGQSTDFNIALP